MRSFFFTFLASLLLRYMLKLQMGSKPKKEMPARRALNMHLTCVSLLSDDQTMGSNVYAHCIQHYSYAIQLSYATRRQSASERRAVVETFERVLTGMYLNYISNYTM